MCQLYIAYQLASALISVSIILKLWHIYYDISYNVQLKHKKWLRYLVSDNSNKNSEDKLLWFVKHKFKYGNIAYTLKITIGICLAVFLMHFVPWISLYFCVNEFMAYLVEYVIHITVLCIYGIVFGIIRSKTPRFDDKIYINDEARMLIKCLIFTIVGSMLCTRNL